MCTMTNFMRPILTISNVKGTQYVWIGNNNQRREAKVKKKMCVPKDFK